MTMFPEVVSLGAGEDGFMSDHAVSEVNDSSLGLQPPMEAHQLDQNVDILPPNQIPTSNFSTTSLRELSRSGIYWRQPAVMILSGVLGILLSIGHHIYYSKLHGTLASTPDKQQWPIRFGTAFSILTMICFSVAISEACTQLMGCDVYFPSFT
ncbi:hypothetical protein BDZ45DRAFT_673706 [Acephala macrosclerotiorum]|nr:hypothetical protein BDZ45DRAFT_673706 [Acephala macrosclerotiorum]